MAWVLRLKVHRVQLGGGPPLVSFRARGIQWGLGSLLIGARLDLVGTNPHVPVPEALKEAAERARRPLLQLALALAGPLTSAAAAVALLTLLHVAGTHVPVPLTIGQVMPGSPAARAGMRPGDWVVRLEGAPVDTWRTFVAGSSARAGASVELTLFRDAQPLVLRVTPQTNAPGEGALGLTQQYAFRRLGPVEATGAALSHAGAQLRLAWEAVEELLSSTRQEGLSPLADLRRSAERGATGLDGFLRSAALWCLVLCLLHLLPIPPMDGGAALLSLAGLKRGRPVPGWLETWLAVVGFALLLALGGLWIRQRLPRPGAVNPVPPRPRRASGPGATHSLTAGSRPVRPPPRNIAGRSGVSRDIQLFEHAMSIPSSPSSLPGLYCELHWGQELAEARAFGSEVEEVRAAPDEAAPMPLYGFGIADGGETLARRTATGYRVFPPPGVSLFRKEGRGKDAPLEASTLLREGGRAYVDLTAGQTLTLSIPERDLRLLDQALRGAAAGRQRCPAQHGGPGSRGRGHHRLPAGLPHRPAERGEDGRVQRPRHGGGPRA